MIGADARLFHEGCRSRRPTRRREPEMRRRETFIAHREFFHAVTIQETVALACTCRRGADHWYGEPMRAADHLASEAAPPAREQAAQPATGQVAIR